MIRQLPKGYQVRYRHERPSEMLFTANTRKLVVAPRGGKTIAIIHDAKGREIVRATAICRPDEGFNKRLGRMVSLGRALKELEPRPPKKTKKKKKKKVAKK